MPSAADSDGTATALPARSRLATLRCVAQPGKTSLTRHHGIRRSTRRTSFRFHRVVTPVRGRLDHEVDMGEEAPRRQAVQQRLAGVNVTDIAAALVRTDRWARMWVARYEQATADEGALGQPDGSRHRTRHLPAPPTRSGRGCAPPRTSTRTPSPRSDDFSSQNCCSLRFLAPEGRNHTPPSALSMPRHANPTLTGDLQARIAIARASTTNTRRPQQRGGPTQVNEPPVTCEDAGPRVRRRCGVIDLLSSLLPPAVTTVQPRASIFSTAAPVKRPWARSARASGACSKR